MSEKKAPTYWACGQGDYCIPAGGEDTPEDRVRLPGTGRNLETEDLVIAVDRKREQEVLVLEA